jgi:hypothetical protein
MTALVAIKTAPRTRYLAWLPAVLLVAWGILSAAGVPLTPSSLAASTGTTTVSATVAKEVHIALDTAGNCGPAGGSNTARSLTGSALNTSQDGSTAFATCRATFGSNNSALGATLLIESTRTAGTKSFCTDAVGSGACAGSTFSDAPTGGETMAAFQTDEGKFGVKVTSPGATCSGGMVTGGNVYGLGQNTDATPNGASVCATASTTDGTVDVNYHANSASNQPAGTYNVETTVTATAN